MPNYIGKPEGVATFGRTYDLKFYDTENNLIFNIYQDDRNAWNGLRITFEVDQQYTSSCTAGSIANTATIGIYNLSSNTKRTLSTAHRLVLSAGYELNSGIIYEGNLINTYDLRMQPDYLFQILCMDYADQYPPISVHIPKGKTPSEILHLVGAQIKDLLVDDANFKGLSTQPYNKEINITQMEYSQALSKVGLMLDISAFVANGQLFAISEKLQEQPENSVVTEIDFSNGLIGSPIYNLANSGVNATCFLNHLLIPTNVVQIKTLAPQVQVGQAKFINYSQDSLTRGQWNILTTKHTGDSREGAWQTYFEAYALQPLGQSLT